MKPGMVRERPIRIERRHAEILGRRGQHGLVLGPYALHAIEHDDQQADHNGPEQQQVKTTTGGGIGFKDNDEPLEAPTS